MHYETYAEIDLDALVHNLEQIKGIIGGAKIMMVLKANAYAHGATEIMNTLYEAGVTTFAVANFYEAMELRVINPKASILILGYVSPPNIKTAIENNIALTVFSEDYWKTVAQAADRPFSVHIKVNTGFNRIGFDPGSKSSLCIKDIWDHPLASIEGIYSHFALTSEESDKKQHQVLVDFADRLEKLGIFIPCRHIADSIATVIHPWSHMNMVRLGAVLYGLKAGYPAYDALDLKPTLKLWSTISQVRMVEKGEGISYDGLFAAPEEMPVGTVSFGYADGPPRAMGKEQGHVLIHGKKAPILGLMCMDQCMIDLRGIPEAKAGDKVLIMDIDTESPVSVAALATKLGTNKNDVLVGISKRVTRIYRKGGKSKASNDLYSRIEDRLWKKFM